jgi:uncharacterized phage protein gp47/JayE
MAIVTPTTAQISDNIVAQLQASLGQAVPLLPRAFIRVLAKAIAGVFVILYKYGGFVGLMQVVKYAPYPETTINGRKFSPLIEWGVLSGIGYPSTATRAELQITIPVALGGETIQAGETLYSAVNGYTYATTSAVVLSTPSVVVNIRAIGDPNDTGGKGTEGNLAIASTLKFTNTGIEVTVAAEITVAADAESEVLYRQRVVSRFSAPPQGGAYADYRIWSTSVAGISNAYPYTGATAGTVSVYAEATVASSASPDGIPTSGQLLAVAEAIELDDEGLASRRPIGSLVTVYPISRTSFDVTVTGLSVTGSLVEVEEQIRAALLTYFASRAPYIVGLDTQGRSDRVTSTAIGGVVDDVASAANGIFTSVATTQSGSPVTLYTLGQGEKAKLGTLTYA